MTAVFLAPVYLVLHIYLLLRLFHWLGAFHRHFTSRIFRWCFGVCFVAMAATPLAGFLIAGGPVHRACKIAGNIWLGMLLYILLIVGCMDLICLIIRRTAGRRGKTIDRGRLTRRAGSIAAAGIVAVSVFGTLHAGNIQVKRADLILPKSCAAGDLKVALIADLHLGYNMGTGMMEQMVAKLNREEPDLVCLAGDIFDNEYEAIHDPDRVADILAGIKSRYGVYACWGNHDVKERVEKPKQDDPRFAAFLKRARINLLEDESLLVDDAFYLAGRKDPAKSRKLGEERLSPEELTAGMEADKPVLVMDHQPRQLAELAAAGTDVDLSGHTHAGQVFPGNLLVRLFWDNAYGIVQKDGMYSCVTSGVGIWGPAMRVGTQSEIMLLHLRFHT